MRLIVVQIFYFSSISQSKANQAYDLDFFVFYFNFLTSFYFHENWNKLFTGLPTVNISENRNISTNKFNSE